MAGRIFLFIFGFFWTALTGAALAAVGYGIVNQLRTLSFTQSIAIIDSIERTEQAGDDAPSYGVAVSYHYTVDGRQYQATRLRYLAGSSSDSWAASIVARMKKGSEVPVYYNAGNPSEAVLIRGLEGFDLFILQFLTPFAMIMFGFWIAGLRLLWPRRGFSGLVVEEAGALTRIRPSRWTPIGVGLAAMGLTAFLGIFPVAFIFGGFHPSLTVATISWACILTLGIAAWATTQWKIAAGREDLRLDDRQQTLQFQRRQIAYGDVSKIELKTIAGKSSDSYQIWVHFKERGQPSSIKVKDEGELQEAQRFSVWMSLKIGAPVEPAALSLAAATAQRR